MKLIDQSALRDFDHLPDSAYVRLPVVTALLAVSPATVWRWTREGRLPRPTRISGVTLWNAGELRSKLREAGLQLTLAVQPSSGEDTATN